jgi:hypothetical protein
MPKVFGILLLVTIITSNDTKFIIWKNVFQWHHVPSHRAYLMVPVQYPKVAMIVPVKMALEEQIVKVCRNI